MLFDTVFEEYISSIYPSQEKWKNIEKDFYNRRDLPNCVGALDGKHLRVQYLLNSGSEYYNYKGYYNIWYC